MYVTRYDIFVIRYDTDMLAKKEAASGYVYGPDARYRYGRPSPSPVSLFFQILCIDKPRDLNQGCLANRYTAPCTKRDIQRP